MNRIKGLLIAICIMTLTACGGSANQETGIKNDIAYDLKTVELEISTAVYPLPVLTQEGVFYLQENDAEDSLMRLDFDGELVSEHTLLEGDTYNVLAHAVGSDAMSYLVVAVKDEKYPDARWRRELLCLDGEGKTRFRKTLEAPDGLPPIVIEDERVKIAFNNTAYVYNKDGDFIGTEDYIFLGGNFQEILDWEYYGFEYGKVKSVIETDRGGFIALYADGEIGKYELIHFTPDTETALKKQELILGVLEKNALISEAVVSFNKKSDSYVVAVKEYMPVGSDISTDDAISQMLADVVAGIGPDIMELGLNADYEAYASKGLFEELSPYVEQSESIAEEDYLLNAWEFGKYNGGQYIIPASIGMQMLACKEEYVGATSGISIEEFLNLAKEFPDREILRDASKEDILSACLVMNLERFLDEENAVSKFADQEFTALLTDIKQIPVSEMDSFIFEEVLISNMSSYIRAFESMGEDVCFVGYPTEEGKQAIVGSPADLQFTISSFSKHKDAAWQFIENYIVDYAGENSMLPTNRNALRKRVLEEMNNYPYCDMWDEQEKLRHAEVFIELCESAEPFPEWDEDVANILAEEIQIYFAGERDAYETARVIDNRVTLILQEKK